VIGALFHIGLGTLKPPRGSQDQNPTTMTWIRGYLGLLHVFLAKRFQLHALPSREKKIKLWEHLKRYFTNSNFLWICSTIEIMEQSQTTPYDEIDHWSWRWMLLGRRPLNLHEMPHARRGIYVLACRLLSGDRTSSRVELKKTNIRRPWGGLPWLLYRNLEHHKARQ
jgi:hypothetical protein